MSGDAAERAAALDPRRSCIVQAPAGSGKTELLTQRFLRLLAAVNEPEEVVAVTFTRKAAAEMRQRVLQALAAAAGDPPAAAHERQRHAFARAARDHGEARGWELAATPNRLRIQTLDALCAAIARQLPRSAGLGGPPAVASEAQPLYRAAARRCLQQVEANDENAAAIAVLLGHAGTDLGRLEELLAAMLGRRDQWLRFTVDSAAPALQRDNLEAALARAVQGGLQRAASLFPAAAVADCLALAAYAGAQREPRSAPLVELGSGARLPPASPETLADARPHWQALAQLVLTQDGNWRKSVDKRQGFPAKGNGEGAAERAAMKERYQELIAELAAVPGLEQTLAALQTLPPGAYDDERWQVVAAMLRLLNLAAAELQLVFAERGEVDFVEITARAGQALGGPDAPSDLALALDFRLAHLLVDEFQDTSLPQLRLLETLVAGWQPGDGRSLFLVGDPMQSVYRFRQAEVGLFLLAIEAGVGGVPLDFLRLRANFRSRAGLVAWVNSVFPQVLPAAADAGTGAVPYAPAEAQRPGPQTAPELLLFEPDDARGEAARVAQIVAQARARDPDASVAVLVRSRAQAAPILPALRAAGLAPQAVALEFLAERPTVNDLLALTRCLLHAADRLHWLAVLRAPWCGLSLADLLVLAGHSDHSDDLLWERLNDDQVLAGLSPDGAARASRLRGVLAVALAERGRRRLRRWVEGVWLALGGPAAVAGSAGLADAKAYLDLLEALEQGGDIADFGLLDAQVAKLYAPPDPAADPKLQVMTMHKAKGLEFDTVIVPGLGRGTGSDKRDLLNWLVAPRPGGGQDLLLAPITAVDESAEPIVDYLRSIDKEKDRLEQARLLYVAATRAREQLVLIGNLAADKEEPAKGTLLASVWPALGPAFLAARVPPVTPAGADSEPALMRLPANWQAPAVPPGLAAPPVVAAPDAAAPDYEWASPEARHLGTVVHAALQRIAQDGLAAWPAPKLAALGPWLSAALAERGVPAARRDQAAARALTALQRSLADSRGRWLLGAHDEAFSEYPLTGRLAEGRRLSVVIDRSFVADGTRWIVDYKTGGHEGANLGAFLDREVERYRHQMETYAALVGLQETRPIRLGLYFPLVGGWREWAPSPGAAGAG